MRIYKINGLNEEQASDFEKNFYFVMNNGINVLRENSETLNKKYSNYIKDYIKNIKGKTKITVIVSILIIMIVGFLISPILGNKEK